MGHDALAPEFPGIERTAPVPHSRWLDDRWTGLVELRWGVDPEHPVMIGAGWQRVVKPLFQKPRQGKIGKDRVAVDEATSTEIRAEVVRRRDDPLRRIPVLPGSSLKGAVRQAYEFLSPSCMQKLQGKRKLCSVKPGSRHGRVCPACSLFGARGYGGRLSFGEAEPVNPATSRPVPARVPCAWKPQKPVPGEMRIHDLDVDRQYGEPRETPEKVEVVRGAFTSELRVVNASFDELGLLFVALGVGDPFPGLRLGGKKFHGFGSVRVQVAGARPRYPDGPNLDREAAGDWAAQLAVEALRKDPQRRSARERYLEAIGRTPP